MADILSELITEVNYLSELITEVNYAISWPPQPGDPQFAITDGALAVGAHAEWVAEAG